MPNHSASLHSLSTALFCRTLVEIGAEGVLSTCQRRHTPRVETNSVSPLSTPMPSLQRGLDEDLEGDRIQIVIKPELHHSTIRLILFVTS